LLKRGVPRVLHTVRRTIDGQVDRLHRVLCQTLK
jgi:hypothetical protein